MNLSDHTLTVLSNAITIWVPLLLAVCVVAGLLLRRIGGKCDHSRLKIRRAMTDAHTPILIARCRNSGHTYVDTENHL